MNKKIDSFYNNLGERYSRSWTSYGKKYIDKFETEQIIKSLEKSLKNNSNTTIKVLDLGMGTGRITDELTKYNVNYYGIDISETMINFCKEKFKNNKKVKSLTVVDMEKYLPVEFEKFHLITAVRCLYYSRAWKENITKTYGLLNPGGILFFSFPNSFSSTYFSSLFHRKNIKSFQSTKKELKKIVIKAGFSDVNIVGYARLPDVFYDFCKTQSLARVIFFVEKIIRLFLGDIFLTRMFYVSCLK